MLMSLVLGGCSLGGETSAPTRSASGATIAFESIDGLPRDRFQKLVEALTTEADARQIAVISREGKANYRARGYAAVHLRGRQTVIAWTWDIFDAERERALRITGEEKITGRNRDWSAADDATIARIARESMAQLAYFLNSPSGSTPAPQPAPAPGVAIAENAAPDAVRTSTVTAAAAPAGTARPGMGWSSQRTTRASVAAYSPSRLR